MTQVSSAVDVLWDLYMAHPEKLSKADWEYLIRNHADALVREILIKDMHNHIKPVQDKHEQQWRIANQAILQRIGQCIGDAEHYRKQPPDIEGVRHRVAVSRDV